MLPDYILVPLVLQWLIWPIVRPLFWYFGHFEVRGLENLKDVPAGAIFASNHTSELDAILIPAALPFFSRFRPFYYTSRERAFYSGTGWRQKFYGGLLFKSLGAYPLLPGKHNYAQSLHTHIRITKNKRSVIIFPEGKIGKPEQFNEAHGGVAYIAHAAHAPIVPISIAGTYKLTRGDFFRRRRHFILTFGKPIYLKDLIHNNKPIITETENDFKRAGQMILDTIRRQYETSLKPAPALSPSLKPKTIEEM